MNIIVCVKQVPSVAAMKFDPATKTLVREGVPLEVSSFDIRALAHAVDIVRQHGGEVVALTMGPPQAAEALRHCLALGAHRAIHLCDRAFAGADTLATARALALAVKREKFDLVLCGRWSVDAETGQVGPELAEFLDIPQVTGARSVSFNADRTVATVERETDEGTETLEAPLPLLLTAAEDLAAERFPTKKDREAAKARPIATVTAAELSSDLSIFGLAGSPTSVKEIITLQSKRRCAFVEGDTAATKVGKLVALLREEGLFGTWKRPGPPAPALLPCRRPTREDRALWVVVEMLDGRVRRVTLELLGKAQELAAKLGGEIAAVVAGELSGEHHRLLAAHGADCVCSLGAGEPCDALAAALAARKPHSVLFGSTAIGRDLAPRVAARLGLGLTSDCIGLEIDAAANLVQHKPAFGGNVVAPILSRTFPQMATVRPGVLQPAIPDDARRAKVVTFPPGESRPPRTKVLATRKEPRASDLDTAEIVVGFGMGIGDSENLPVVRALADVLGAPLATTRDVTDRGWISKHHQVGLTGKSIAPRLYFAIGIRGAFEHTVGIRNAGLVVAINDDDQAWIWDAADVGIKGDWREIVPLLAKALAAARPTSA